MRHVGDPPGFFPMVEEEEKEEEDRVTELGSYPETIALFGESPQDSGHSQSKMRKC